MMSKRETNPTHMSYKQLFIIGLATILIFKFSQGYVQDYFNNLVAIILDTLS